MPDKPRSAAGYPPGQLQWVRATCLYAATKLGDLIDDIVVVGGLVPSLLIPQMDLPAGVSPHVGTMDLDLGLAFALITDERYQEILRLAQLRHGRGRCCGTAEAALAA